MRQSSSRAKPSRDSTEVSPNKKTSDSKQEVYVEQNCLVCVVSAVSMMAAQEYDGMKEQLDLEQNLRVKAESYAHEVKK